jgi:hypothetical protein
MLRSLIAAALAALLALAGGTAALADQRAMVVVGGGTAAVARFGTASTTSYLSIGGASSEVTQTEALAQTPWGGAGTFTNFHIQPAGNTRGTDTTVCIRVNGADALCNTWGSTSTSAFLDTSTTLNIAAGDLVSVAVTTGTGTGVFQLKPISWQFTTTSGQVFTHLSSHAPLGVAGTTAARFYATGGRLEQETTEAQVNLKALEAFTASNLVAAVSANTASTPTFTFRKNAADTALAYAFGSGATGRGEDTVNSVAVAAGDVFAIGKPATGGSVTAIRTGIKYAGAVAGRVMQVAYGSAGPSAAVYVAPGMSATGETTPTPVKVRIPFASTVSKLSVQIRSYGGGTTDLVVDLEKNGASIRQFTIPAGSTFPGTFTDPSGAEDAFAAGDELDVKVSGMNAALGLNAVTFLHTDSNATGGGGATHRRGGLLRGVR